MVKLKTHMLFAPITLCYNACNTEGRIGYEKQITDFCGGL